MTDRQSILNQEYANVLEQTRPFFQLRPRVFPDGNLWCALYGENLQEGVAGFGETPYLASYDFDKNWMNQKAGPSQPKYCERREKCETGLGICVCEDEVSP